MSVQIAPGAKVTQGFTYNGVSGHKGIDLDAAAGTPISAGWAGTVVRADYDTNLPSFGWHVRVKAGPYLHIYGHLRKPPAVKVGQRVVRGTRLGEMGSTGTSTGNHVHVEIRKDGVPVNPAPYLSDSKIPGLEMIVPGGKENPIEQAGDVVTSAAGGLLTGVDAIGAFFGALGERATWIRVLQVVGGAALVTAGVIIVGKGVISDVAVSALPGGGVIKAAAGK